MTTARLGLLNDAAYTEELTETDRHLVETELELAHISFERVWQATGAGALADAPPLDLLAVDYGALWASYGTGASDYSHAVRRYADEHPGTLVVLWTQYTAAIYAAVFEADFGREKHAFVPNPHDDADRFPCAMCDAQKADHGLGPTGNVMFHYGQRQRTYSGWVSADVADDFWPQVRAWLGQTAIVDNSLDTTPP